MSEGVPFGGFAARVKPGSKVEKEATKWAEEIGYFSFKIEKTNKRGVPDRFYLMTSRHFFVEFKGPREVVKEQQRRRIKDIVKKGGEAWVCRSLAYFKHRVLNPRDYAKDDYGPVEPLSARAL